MESYAEDLEAREMSDLERKTRERMKKIAASAEQDAEHEKVSAESSWLSAYRNKLVLMQGSLSALLEKEPDLLEKYQHIELKLAELENHLEELPDEYKKKDSMVPEDEKRRLLDGLDVLK